MSYTQHIQDAAAESARCAVLTLSDTRTAETDKSGRLICELLQQSGHAVVDYGILPDEPSQLSTILQELLARVEIDAILTNGGTGISRRDQTVDVIERVLDQPLPGFGELFRMLSWQQIGSGAMLSRAIGGISRGKIVFALPGSSGAVELAMTKLILPEMKHLLRELRK